MSGKNDTKYVKVTVVVVYNGNGTYLRQPKDDALLQVLEPILLAILFLIAFAINMFLLVTILSSFTLRKVPFNTLLANISFVCLPECLFNMLIAIYYATTDSWKLGSTMCSLSAFIIQIVTLEITFGLCIMCIEGSISLWRPTTFQNYLTVKKQVVAIVTLWVAGLLLCSPLLVGSISSRAFPLRYGCGSADNEGYIHSIFVTVWCYAIPVILGFCSFVYLAIRKYRDYKARKSKKNDINYSDILFQGDLWTEWVNMKLVSLIALIYVGFEVPYIVIHQISSLKTYTDDITTNTTLPLVEYTPNYDTTLTWFRYLFVCLYPILAFWMRKDIRRKLQSLLNCCQKNTVGDHSPLPVIRRETKKKKRDDKKVNLTPLSLTTPVLYISPDGLCLRQLDSSAKLNDKSKKHLSALQDSNLNWTVEPSFVSYLCDISYSAPDKETIHKGESNSISNESPKRRSPSASEISVTALENEFENLQVFPDTKLESTIDELPHVVETPNAEFFSDVEPQPKIRKPKRVRFAETITIYKSITPTLGPPSPRHNERSTVISKPLAKYSGSRIPTRYRSANGAPPWKVEMNETYRVSAPSVEHKTVRSVVPSKAIVVTMDQERRNTKKSIKTPSPVKKHFI